MRQVTRRDALRTGIALTVSLAGCGAAPRGPSDGGDGDGGGGGNGDGDDGGGTATVGTATTETPRVGVERVAEGFRSPVDVAADGDRFFVVDQPGRIDVVDDGRETFLDIRDRVVDIGGYDERGLLGMALHPNFAENGRLFVRYSAPRRGGTPPNYDHTFVLSEFTVDPGATSADPGTERPLLELPQPQPNHNAGSLTFGPDGYLYVGTGDGGGANDTGRGHVDDWYDANGGGNGQDVSRNLLGSILRIDVDRNRDRDAGDDGRAYGIPEDNPLVGREGGDEQFAWGFRNPWRMGFSDGTLYVADVGQNRYEEVDRVEKGGNYGWNVREGTHCFSTGSPSSPPSSCPTETPDGDPLVDPVVEYPHGGAAVSGLAVIGGYVYDGDELPGLTGEYVFADWRAQGRLFAATPRDEESWSVSEVPVVGGGFGRYVLSFGRADDGRLYVLTTDRGSIEGDTGALSRLTPP